MAGFADAISQVESGGNYSALGPKTRSGDRAYGKYQVMGTNIGPWTKEVLGFGMTPQQFLQSPQAQDAVFNAKFGQYVTKYGNPNDAASMWFTGRPLAQGANRSDINGTTGAQYVGRFNQAMADPRQQSAPQMPAISGPTGGPQPSAAPAGLTTQSPAPGAAPNILAGSVGTEQQVPPPPPMRPPMPFRPNVNYMPLVQAMQRLGGYSFLGS